MKYKTFENGGSVEGSVSINGLVMTGPLKLLKDPVLPNEVVNKQYVDNVASNIDAATISSGIIPVDRMPAFTGDFNSVAGSGVITLKNSGVVPGTYTKVTVNSSGLVTAGAALVAADIPPFGWEKITTGKPNTLDGYGITNAVNRNNGTVNGNIVLAADPVAPNDAVTKRYVTNLMANRAGFIPGDIISNGKSTVPSGFLRCNGGELSKTLYAALYAAIGDTYGEEVLPGRGIPSTYQTWNTAVNNFYGATWTADTALPAMRYRSGVVVTKNRVYLIGGYNGTAQLATSVTAPITAGGVVGTWAAGPSLPIALGAFKTYCYKNFVYTISGHAADSLGTDKIFRAPINADGTIGSFTELVTKLPYPSYSCGCFISKNIIHYFGGATGSGTYLSGYWYATIDNSGNIGTWTQGPSLPVTTTGGAIVVTKNRVYIVGGNRVYGTETFFDLIMGTIDQNGIITSWQSLTDPATNFPFSMYNPMVVQTANKVYVLGGRPTNNDDTLNTVVEATINLDGTLGPWSIYGTLPDPMQHASVFATYGRLYIAGYAKVVGSTTYSPNVWWMPWDSGISDYTPYIDGTVGYTTSPNNFRLPDFTTQQNPIGDYVIKAT